MMRYPFFAMKEKPIAYPTGYPGDKYFSEMKPKGIKMKKVVSRQPIFLTLNLIP